MKLFIIRLAILALFSIPTAFAQKAVVFNSSGTAIRGYDPVAYFTDGKPVKGDSSLTYLYEGATWQFATPEHRDAFKADPQQYAPQYGGYCAYGTSQGHKAPTEPDAWTIVDGKLYLNYNSKVKTLWNKDQAGNIGKANTNWPTVKDSDGH